MADIYRCVVCFPAAIKLRRKKKKGKTQEVFGFTEVVCRKCTFIIGRNLTVHNLQLKPFSRCKVTMAQYKGAASEAGRAMQLMKKREREREQLEQLKQKIAEASETLSTLHSNVPSVDPL